MNAKEIIHFFFFFNKKPYPLKSGKPLKFVDQFTYLGSSISSTESNDDISIRVVWIVIYWLYIIKKSDISNKIKLDFFQAVALMK